MKHSSLSGARSLAYAIILAATALTLALLYLSPMSFSLRDALPVIALISALVLGSWYCRFRRMETFAVALECQALGIFLVIPGLISTYLAASLNMPLADDRLATLDTALGFNWEVFIQFVNAHPTLSSVLAYSYHAFPYQLLALPLILAVAGRSERAYAFISIFALSCFISTLIFIWFPAVGTYAYYGAAAGTYPNIDLHYGFEFLSDFFAVRSHPDIVLSIYGMSGVVTFPSVHAAVAILCIWATCDIRFIRIPFAVLNALMAASAVAIGSHYLIDIIAGFLVAAVAILATKAILARLAPTGYGAPLSPAQFSAG